LLNSKEIKKHYLQELRNRTNTEHITPEQYLGQTSPQQNPQQPQQQSQQLPQQPHHQQPSGMFRTI
jgi:hypothetical protein